MGTLSCSSELRFPSRLDFLDLVWCLVTSYSLWDRPSPECHFSHLIQRTGHRAGPCPLTPASRSPVRDRLTPPLAPPCCVVGVGRQEGPVCGEASCSVLGEQFSLGRLRVCLHALQSGFTPRCFRRDRPLWVKPTQLGFMESAH